MKSPVMLMILDGFGISKEKKFNAIANAKTPNIDKLMATWPKTSLLCSGMSVGLPEGQMGNSEVGHTNIGSGRVVYQELTRITKSINDGDFFENSVLVDAMSKVKKASSTLHIMGLLSDGGVHSHIDHIIAMVEMAKRQGVKNVELHCFMDGRDTPPMSGIEYVKKLQNCISKIGVGQIATISGRYYAMDRDKNWDRVAIAYDNLIAKNSNTFENAIEAMQTSYDNDKADEFVIPIRRNSFNGIKNNDAIILCNFRPDRAREITRAFVDKDFDGFEREQINLSSYVCMTQYDATIQNVEIAFKPTELTNVLGKVLENSNLKQLRTAETEKYAHVTFFFNGGVEEQFKGEDRILVPSPKVATYDLKPEMSAFEVKDKLIEALNKEIYDVIIINFANCDMVGHTGIYEAAVKAVEAVDKCVGEICDNVLAHKGVVFLTADHGNSEQMIDGSGNPQTAHTTNPVPFVAIGAKKELRDGGALCDIAPTMLDYLNITKPLEMTGVSLFK